MKAVSSIRSLVLACAVSVPWVAHAGLLVGFMADKNGQAVQDAVLFATPLEGSVPPATGTPETVSITQENYLFLPYVVVLRKGTPVRFSNHDSRDHHIKSFSLTKAFEMRVPGKAEAAQNVVFDKVGDVAMVCHFHDAMRGFVYVVDTPYFAKTDKAGNAVLNNLPPGKYQVQAWVPTMIGGPLSQTVQVGESGSAQVRFQIDFVPKPAPQGRAIGKTPPVSG